MQISDEMAEAIRSELSTLRFAAATRPETTITELYMCGCVGPRPECKCAKRERLISEFLAQFEQ